MENLPLDIDKECVELCQAMNLIPGIRTVESCCGHGERPYHIWFRPRHLSNLPRLLYYFDECHCGYYGWRARVYTDCAMSPVVFLIEGPVGEEAYQQSKEIARLLRQEMKQL